MERSDLVYSKRKMHNLSHSNCLYEKRLEKNPFHKEILYAWSQIDSDIPDTPKNILNQYLIDNKYIMVDLKPIKSTFLGKNNIDRLKNIKTIDLLDNNYKFKNKNTFEEGLVFSILIIKYNHNYY